MFQFAIFASCDQSVPVERDTLMLLSQAVLRVNAKSYSANKNLRTPVISGDLVTSVEWAAC